MEKETEEKPIRFNAAALCIAAFFLMEDAEFYNWTPHDWLVFYPTIATPEQLNKCFCGACPNAKMD